MNNNKSAIIRDTMVDRQIEARGIDDPAVLKAMREIPREKFVLSSFQPLAYSDQPLPIEEGQTISQPYIVALMAANLHLTPEDTVLEVGTGSGYAAAVLSRIAKKVYTIEYFPKLATSAETRLRDLGYTNIEVKQGDGSHGWPEHAPYQAISVAAGGDIPEALLEQLAPGGRLIMPVDRDGLYQDLMLIIKRSDGTYTYTNLGAVRFVPLL